MPWKICPAPRWCEADLDVDVGCPRAGKHTAAGVAGGERGRLAGARRLVKALVLGIVTSGLLSLISIAGMQTGVSPMPGPLGLVVAKTIFAADELPLVVGLLNHTAWVTVWALVFVALFRRNPTFIKALGLGLLLWVMVLVVFFPAVGWGFFGLRHGATLIAGSLVPHVLFAIFLWGGSRLLFPEGRAGNSL